MKISYILVELFVYLALPYIIWTHGRGILGDYYSMLISTIPGIVYTIYRFMKDRQFNLIGIFIITSLLLSSVLDLLAGSALQMLWNSVFLSYAFTFIYIISMIIQKPLAIYIAVEFMYLQGFSREKSKRLYFMKGNVKLFQWVTAIFVLRGLLMNSIMVWLIIHHGVDAFMHLIILRKALGFIFSILIFVGFLLAGNKAMKLMKDQENEWKGQPVEAK